MDFIYAILLGMGFGFIIDLYVCVFSNKEIILTRKNSLLKLLNTFVYGSGTGLLFLISLIPVFSMVVFIPLFMILGSIVCTGTELVWGILINKILYKWTKKKLWDYSHSKINFMGQIDLAHSIGWLFLSVAVLIFFKIIF